MEPYTILFLILAFMTLLFWITIDVYFHRMDKNRNKEHLDLFDKIYNEMRKFIFIQKDSETNVEELLCVICKTNKRTIMSLECQHLSCCFNCSNKLFEKKLPCPICRKERINLLQVYL